MPGHEIQRRQRPGGRSARVRSAVLAATAELLVEGGYDLVEVPRRSPGVPASIPRRSIDDGRRSPRNSSARRPRSDRRFSARRPTRDRWRGDLACLVSDGAGLIRTSVRSPFQVLLTGAETTKEVAAARDRFWAAHLGRSARHRRSGSRQVGVSPPAPTRRRWSILWWAQLCFACSSWAWSCQRRTDQSTSSCAARSRACVPSRRTHGTEKGSAPAARVSRRQPARWPGGST